MGGRINRFVYLQTILLLECAAIELGEEAGRRRQRRGRPVRCENSQKGKGGMDGVQNVSGGGMDDVQNMLGVGMADDGKKKRRRAAEARLEVAYKRRLTMGTQIK